MKRKFRARLFVTLSYKGSSIVRDIDTILARYINNMDANGLDITALSFIKYGSGGHHDRFAKGNYYNVQGLVKNCETKELTKFKIFHNARVDYFNAFPITYSSIKLVD